MKYKVSASTLYPVYFEDIEIEVDDADELHQRILDELTEALADMDIEVSKEEVSK